ncbi:hypothetical protein WJX81_003218 [Elliptochloris bilobata]|uniref:DUF8204 domain-containing protein n=1 Tax=Elliptochloris bilobata TaxID=381761 RepID=A0AAW1R263_9CHLO
MPVCAGLRNQPNNRDVPNLSEELTAVPAGAFKYVCVGYAVYDEEKLRQQMQEAKKSPTAPIELPYCEGLEVISAPQLQQSPAVLSAPVGAAATANAQPRPLDEGPTRKQRPLRDTTLPGRMPGNSLGDMNWKEFSERVQRNAAKIVNKMGVNAQLVLDTVKSVIDEGRKGR